MWDGSYQGSAETGWGDQHLLPLPFHFVYICVLLSGRNIFCIPDRDNEIHSGQGERGWWVRQRKRPKPMPWLRTGYSVVVPRHCHTRLHTGIGFLHPPPPSSGCPFPSPPSGSRGNHSALRKTQLISLGLAKNIQNPFLIRVFHIKLV